MEPLEGKNYKNEEGDTKESKGLSNAEKTKKQNKIKEKMVNDYHEK